jgi:glutaminyl-tRNA synthetase
MSKRKLLQLVKERHVRGWDDPRMPTICGLRRRGFTPESIRRFCERIGVARFNSTIDVTVLENSVREHLNETAPRVMGVLQPLKLVIVNYPAGQVEQLPAVNNPEDPGAGVRQVPFSRELYIEQDDFREAPPKKYFRLAPGAEVRLRYAYLVKCVDVVKDPQTGEIREVHCTYDPETLGKNPADGRKVKGTLHWVSAAHSIGAELRIYQPLFLRENPDEVAEGQTFLAHLNPDSLQVVTSCRLEPGLAAAQVGDRFQFERQGYFCVDPDSQPGALVFNRTVPLRDSWSRIEKQS